MSSGFYYRVLDFRAKISYRVSLFKDLLLSDYQFLTLHLASFNESEYCGGYAGLSYNSGVALKVANATYV